MSNGTKLLTRERYADLPTVRVPVVAKLDGAFASEARRAMQPHESPDGFFLRLWLFYQHANRYDSDTALVAAIARAEAQ